MKRKTSLLPTRIYSYGVPFGPTEGADAYFAELKKANVYYNKCIEIERRRRERVQDILRKYGTTLELQAAFNVLQEEVATAETALKALKSGKTLKEARKVTREDPTHVKALKASRKKAEAAWKAEKKRVAQIEACQTELDQVKELATGEIRVARKTADVYWGTKLQIEASVGQASDMSAAPPQFKRYTGTGRVVVQFQWHPGKEPSVADLFGSGKLLQIKPLPEGAYNLTCYARRKACRTTVRIRVASTKKGEPVWATFPVILHRPLPEDGVPKWAWILRRRVGLHYEYRFQVVIESAGFIARPSTSTKAIAIDLGWRDQKENGFRVAYWMDSDGQHGEVRVPDFTRKERKSGIRRTYSFQDGKQKTRDLRSIRDKCTDEIKALLIPYKKQLKEIWDKTAYLHKWKAAWRFGRLLRDWKTARFSGDEEAFAALVAWDAQDQHLYAWQSHQSDRLTNHRRAVYSEWAARVTRTYGTVIMEEFQLRNLARAAKVETGLPSDGRKPRRNRAVAAPGEFKEILEHAAKKRGVKWVLVKSAYTTKTCHLCGRRDVWEETSALFHTCSGCGATWDRDFNAACNILQLGTSGAMVQEKPCPSRTVTKRKDGGLDTEQ